MINTHLIFGKLQSCLTQNGFHLTDIQVGGTISGISPTMQARMYVDDDLLAFDGKTFNEEAQKRVNVAETMFKTMNEIGKPAEQNETRPLTELTPKRILKSGNRTIVFWQDGTKTMVKRADDEAESDYAAFTAALAKRLYGSNSAVKRIVDKTETQKPKKQKAQKESEEMTVNLFDGDADWLIAKVEAEAQKERCIIA